MNFRRNLTANLSIKTVCLSITYKIEILSFFLFFCFFILTSKNTKVKLIYYICLQRLLRDLLLQKKKNLLIRVYYIQKLKEI